MTDLRELLAQYDALASELRHATRRSWSELPADVAVEAGPITILPGDRGTGPWLALHSREGRGTWYVAVVRRDPGAPWHRPAPFLVAFSPWPTANPRPGRRAH